MPDYRLEPRDDYERAILDVCREALSSAESSLGSRGLESKLRGIVDISSDTSELLIDFVGQGGIQDVIEFGLRARGAAVQDPVSLRDWLNAELANVGT